MARKQKKQADDLADHVARLLYDIEQKLSRKKK